VAGLAVRDVRHGACVDDVAIGDGRAVNHLDAALPEAVGDLLGVGLVQLAAEGDNRDAPDGRPGGRRSDITSGPVGEERQVSRCQDLLRVRIDAVALPAESDAS